MQIHEQSALAGAAADLGVLGIQVDVSRREDVERLAEEALGRHGRIDGAVDNAGSPEGLRSRS